MYTKTISETVLCLNNSSASLKNTHIFRYVQNDV